MKRKKLKIHRTDQLTDILGKVEGRRLMQGEFDIIEAVDNRSLLVKRYKQLYMAVVSDLGGPEVLSEGQKQLIRRVATLSILAESMEVQFFARQNFNAELYLSVINTMGRQFKSLGLKRQPREINPGHGLATIINSKD